MTNKDITHNLKLRINFTRLGTKSIAIIPAMFLQKEMSIIAFFRFFMVSFLLTSFNSYAQQTYSHSYAAEAASALLPLYNPQPPIDPLARSSNHGDLFEYTLSDLLSYREIMPYAIDDVVRSINTPIALNFPCRAGGYQQVAISIRTNHALRTDYQLTNQAQYAGRYWWKAHTQQQGTTRLIFFDNLLQLSNLAFINPKDDVQALKNMALLYHELLHGQLMIDAIKNNPNTRAQLCGTNEPDVSAADGLHQRVPTYEQAFIMRYAHAREDLLPIRIPRGYRQFRLNLGYVQGIHSSNQIAMRLASSGYLDNFVYPPQLLVQGNQLYMLGELRDPNRSTEFVAMFAPAYH